VRGLDYSSAHESVLLFDGEVHGVIIT
jgi:hypothetical protein